ncbi:MAG TPA: carboxypeptidase regulatory-like domain-containing protein [Polyangiaceae bacterium]
MALGSNWAWAWLAQNWLSCLALFGLFAFGTGLYDTRLAPAVQAPAAGPSGGQIAVFVTRDGNAPLPDARVRAYARDGGSYRLAAEQKTRAEGEARLSGLPRGVLVLMVEREGFARRAVRLSLGTKARAVDVRMEAAHRLAVDVRDLAGRPIARATVLVEESDALPFGALTDQGGRARFERLGEGPYRVKVFAVGYDAFEREGVTEDLVVELQRLHELQVKTRDHENRPLGGAEVLIAGSSLWPARRVETDERGEVTIVGLPSGSYDLRATRGSWVSPTLFGYLVGAGDGQSVTLYLEPGRMQRILVTDGDADDAPGVEGADVVLVESGIDSFPQRGRTDANGTVLLGPIAPGPAVASAHASGFVAHAAVPLPEEGGEVLRIALHRGATLSGEVVDTRGFPVDGATIEVIGNDLNGLPIAETPFSLSFQRSHFAWSLSSVRPLIPVGELGVMPGPIPPITAGFGLAGPALEQASWLPGPEDAVVEPWVTRGDGRFTAHPVSPGRVRALVRHPDFVEALSEAVTLAPGGKAEVRVVMHVGGRLDGRVVDRLGRPLEDVRVRLFASSGSFEQSAYTTPDGRFAFAAVPAHVTVALSRPDDVNRTVVQHRVEVPEGQKVEIELELPEEREPFVLVVLDARAEPIGSAQVTLLSLDAEVPYRQTRFTRNDGQVEFEDAAGLRASLEVEAPGLERMQRTFDELPEELELELEVGVIVEGRVTAVRGRRPVEGASVTLLSRGQRRVTTTDADGIYRFENVSPAPVRITVSHLEYAEASASEQVARTTRFDRPFEIAPIDLMEPASVRGRVVDAQGQPVRGARVAAGPVPAFLPAGQLPPGVASTDGEGRFFLERLLPGSATLEAYAADVGRGSLRVELSAGRELGDVVIALGEAAGRDIPIAGGSVAVTLGERGSPGNATVIVVHVASASDAERGGIEAGDAVVAIDGETVGSLDGARERLSGPVGSTVLVAVERNGTPLAFRITREAVRR